MAARGHPPEEDLPGPSAYPDWFRDSEPSWALHQIEEPHDEDLDDEGFRLEARDILVRARSIPLTRGAIANRLEQLHGVMDGTQGVFMKMRVQLIIEDATGTTTATDIAVIERHPDDLIGLSLEEAKAMPGSIQQRFVEAQAREAIERDRDRFRLDQPRSCDAIT